MLDQNSPKVHEQHDDKEETIEMKIVNYSRSTEDSCRTPTSQENKIPIVGSCPPPAPKKFMKMLVCKRKYPHEFDFFEANGSEELELFLRSCDEISTTKDLYVIRKDCIRLG